MADFEDDEMAPHLATMPRPEPYEPPNYFIPKVIHRLDWGGEQGRARTSTDFPMKYVIYTAETEFNPCSNQEECSAEVRRMQKHYMDNGYEDIPYNFIIGNDGNVYEGKGWLFQPSTKDYGASDILMKSTATIDIAVICGHQEIIPENMDMVRDAFKLADKLVEFGVMKKLIHEKYDLIFSDEISDSKPAELKK